MKQRERLELTFGAKDMDLWEYLEQTGLPKASVAKKLMRAGIEAKNGAVAVTPAAVPTQAKKEKPVEPVVEKVVEATVEEVKEVEDKPKGLFGGLAAKR